MSSAEISEDLAKLKAFYAKLYFHLAAEYCRTFGDPGGEALRMALEQFGSELGKASKPGYEHLAHRPRLITLCKAGAFPGEAHSRPNLISLEPNRSVVETLQCPLYDSWRRMGGLQEGLAYCEVTSRAVWSACHPAAEIQQPKLLTKGDGLCRFEVRLPSPRHTFGPSRIPVAHAADYMRRVTDLTAEMYYHLARGLCASFGQKGEAALRRAIRRFGRERGLGIRQQHIRQGLDITLHNLFTHYDFPSDDRFRRNKIELTDQTRLSETLVCPLHGAWIRYADGDHVGRIYCEEVHHAVFAGYDDAVQTNLSSTLTQGDDRCRFAVYLRPANKVESPAWASQYEEQLA